MAVTLLGWRPGIERALRRAAAVAALVAGALVTVAIEPTVDLAVLAVDGRGPTLQTSRVDGAQIVGETSQTLYVSNAATNGYAVGDDANDGTSRSSPFLTISEAARRANRDQAGLGDAGVPLGTRIVINDGAYREFIDWRVWGRDYESGSYRGRSFDTVGAQVPVVFEAENAGRVRIDGADTTRTTDGTTVSYATDATGIDAWEQVTVGGHAAYTHRWVDELGEPIDMGFMPSPFGSNVDYGAIARRRELAFINDRPLRQVLCKSELAPGTFYVSDPSMGEDWVYPYPLRNAQGGVIDVAPSRPCTEPSPDQQIYVVPFDDVAGNWEGATFSTTFRGARVRPDPYSSPPGLPLEDDGSNTLFHIQAKGNIVIRGLTFVHASSRIRGSSAAVRVDNSRNIVFEDTSFVHNNWIGVASYGVRNPTPGQPFTPLTSGLTFRNVTGSHNGGHGITATRLHDIVVEDSAFEFNNWRGDAAGLHNWDPGNKFMWVHDLVVRRSRFANNASHGLWLDTNHVNSTVEDSVFENNRGHGLYVEASIGPVDIRRNTFRNNGRFESYPGIEGYGIFATFSDNVTLDSNSFVGNDIPLVIGGRTEHTHQPISNSYDFETGLSFANTDDDPRGAHWEITNNSFVVTEPTYLMTLGVPLENFGNYLPWAADNDWTHFIETLSASNNRYTSPRAAGVGFAVQNTRTCLRTYGSHGCAEWTDNPPFTDYTFPTWQDLTGQDLSGSRWNGPAPPSTDVPPSTTAPTTTDPRPPPGIDLLATGSFETDAGWSSNSRFARVDDRALDGTSSMRAAGSSGAAVALSESIAVTPGHRYSLTGWVFRSSAVGQQYLDLDDVAGDPNVGRTSDLVGEWEFLEAEWTAPSGVTSVRVRLLSDGASPAPPTGPAWFDAVQFVDLDAIEPPPTTTTTTVPSPSTPGEAGTESGAALAPAVRLSLQGD